MPIRFVKWFKGYLYVELYGYSPERFVNLCRNRRILLWDLRKIVDGYGFYVSVKGFRQLLPIVYKTKTVPSIAGRFGLPFYLYRYRKRKVFFGSLLLFTVVIYLCSLYVWNIEVSGQYLHTKEGIVKFLATRGAKPGVKKGKVDCKAIEDAIRKEYADIGWVSAELRGTKLLIKLTETNMPVPKVSTEDPSHIVASHDGVVTSIITRRGTPMVKEGDVVRKGDVLVSGLLDIRDDSKTVIRRQPVVADADVFIKTQYEYLWEKELQYKAKTYTGSEKTVYGLRIFEKNIFFYNALKQIESFEKYDIIVKESSPKITENFYLPVVFSRKTYKEYGETDKVYAKDELEAMAKAEFTRYIDKLREADIDVLEHSVTLRFTNEKCTAGGKVVVIEQQLEYGDVEDGEWRVTEENGADGEER